MNSIQIENMYKRFIIYVSDEIQKNGLMNEDLRAVLNEKAKANPYHEMVSRNCKMVKEMFKGVVEHKYCLGVSHKMVKLMKQDERLTLEDACRIGAEEMNSKADRVIFPMDEDTFEEMIKELHTCKIIDELDD